jgi:hypothetical protein
MSKITLRTIGLFAAASASLILVTGCRAEQQYEAADENNLVDEKPMAPAPVIEAPYNRARMLLTVVRAASAHAAGQDDAKVQRTLDGKQFEVKLRFGCNGQGPLGDHGWSIDPDGRTLRLRAVPTLTLNDDVVRNVTTEKVEAVEGFWLSRPWLLEAACPVAAPPAQSGSSASSKGEDPQLLPSGNPRVGLAQFFGAEDSRTRQRLGQSFEAVIQLDEGQKIGSHGFDLVVSGRLRARQDGRVILCSGQNPDQPPNCIVAAAIDQVRIENPDDKTVLAEWSI